MIRNIQKIITESGFEKNYTKEVRAQIKDLKYAPNNKGYAQDYIGISISAKKCKCYQVREFMDMQHNLKSKKILY